MVYILLVNQRNRYCMQSVSHRSSSPRPLVVVLLCSLNNVSADVSPSVRHPSQAQLLYTHRIHCASSQDSYVASSARNWLMARCKSTLASVSETHSKLSCICFAIPCRRAEDERWWWSGPASVRSEKCSPFRRERLATSVTRGWRTRE